MKLHKRAGLLANVCSRTLTQDLNGAMETLVSSAKRVTAGSRGLEQ